MPLSKLKRRIIRHFLIEKQTSDNVWECCREKFSSLNDMGRHVNQVHASEINEKEKEEMNRMKESEEHQKDLTQLKQRRGEKVYMKEAI
jgi:uncharacterized C2H2 Zn-finger protein